MRHHDGCPTTDVRGRDLVSKSRETARPAREGGLIGAIGLLAVFADRTGARSVARIDDDDRHTIASRLIFDIAAQLSKGPRMQRPPLGLASRDAGTDTLEILKSDSSPAAFSLTDDAFANAVIHVSLEPSFLSASFLEQPLCTLGPFGLETLAQPVMAMAQPSDATTTHHIPVARDGNILRPKIDTQPVIRGSLRLLGHLACGEQVPLPVCANKVAFTLSEGKHLPLTVSADKGHSKPASNRPDGNRVRIPAKNTVIVGNRAMRPEGALASPIHLVRISHLGDQAYHHLSSQVVSRLDRVIQVFMQLVLPEHTMLPGMDADVIGRGIGYFERAPQRIGLLWRGTQLHLSNQLHGPVYQVWTIGLKPLKRFAPLRGRTTWVSAPKGLVP